MTRNEYLQFIGTPDGFRHAREEDLKKGELAWVWGTHKAEPKAYGPHVVRLMHGGTVHLINGKGREFRHPIAEILVRN